jgi:hypothetical protein
VLDVRAFVATGCMLTGLAGCLAGCFWVDPIVSRPRVQIQVVQPSSIYRGAGVTLAAEFLDRAQGLGTYDWKLFACLSFSQSGAGSCDEVAFYAASATLRNTVTFAVPVMNNAGTDKTQAIQVQLEARSDRGAVAEATGQSGFVVNDAPPGLTLDHSALTFTVGAPVDVFARYTDPDDSLDDVALTWESTPSANLEDLPPVPGGNDLSRTLGKRLVPSTAGTWDVKVIARDPLGVAIERHVNFDVAPDRAPCLAQWQPIAPPPGATLPVSAPTVFQVPLVDDDLDAYPRRSNADQFGTPAFAWSIRPPGAAQRQVITGATSNRLTFDPSVYKPGDIVELRVEIADRKATPLSCGDDEPTCSVAAPATCIQRQTWRVEVR